MTTNSTNTNPLYNLPRADRDRIAYEYRQSGYSWALVAQIMGYASESSARTAGNRHAAAIGAPHGHVRVAGARRSARRASTAAHTAIHRGFGVEIEFVGARMGDVATAIAAALNIPHVHVVDYHGTRCHTCHGSWTFGEWKVERDGSVSNGSGARGTGGEVPTPPLYGEAGLETLAKVMKAISSVGGRVDRRCGLHVHVAADRMTNGQRANVLRSLSRHHDVLDALVARSRRSNGYCLPIRPDVTEQQARNMETTGSFGSGDKYRSVNVLPFARYGTIEVRYHQGTLNGTKAAAWVRLLVALFDAAANDETAGLAPGLAMLDTLATLGRLRRQTATYLTNRAAALAR